MKKIYSVSMPVYAHVTVLVEANTQEEAEELAAHHANLSDAEPIDFSQEDPDVVELEEKDCAGQEIWLSKTESKHIPRGKW